MKNKLSLIWRLAIAIMLVIGLSMTMAAPIAAEDNEAANVNCITIYSPTADCPAFVKPGECFDLTFSVDGTGIGQFGIMLGSNVIFLSDVVCFPIPKITMPVTVPVLNAAGMPFPNDIYDITVAAGRSGQSPLTMPNAVSPLSVIVDSVPPEVSIIRPADDSYVKGCIDVAAEAFDCISGIACVQFAFSDDEGETWEKIDGAQSNVPYCVSWDTICVDDGDYELIAIATDRVGLVTISCDIDVTVDNTKPTIPIVTSPNGGESWLNEQEYAITWVTPEDTNLGEYPITIDLYKSGNFCKNIASDLPAEGPYMWAISGIIPCQEYKVVVTATDLAGNCSSDASNNNFRIYSLDNTVPCVDLTVNPVIAIDSTDFITGKVVVSATASDEESGIAEVQFTYSIDNGASWNNIDGAMTTEPYQKNLDTTCLPDGKILIQAIAYNTTGAWDTDTECFMIDNSAPEVCLKGPASGLYPDGLKLTATAFDEQSGIDEVEFYYSIDGCEWFDIGEASFDDGLYSLVWHGMADGTYKIRAEAVNGVDIEAYSNIIADIVIDTTAPECLELIVPDGGEIYKLGVSYNVNWTTPTDAHLGTNPISLELYKGDAVTPCWSASGLSACGPYCWDVEGLVPGSDYKMKVIATDMAGNWSYDCSDECFTIWGEDSSGPIVDLTCPPANSCFGGWIMVKADACDAETGIQMVAFDYSLDGGMTWNGIGIDSSVPYEVEWDTCALNADNVMVRAVATNGVGISCHDINGCICIDNIPPDVTINKIVCPTNSFPIITGTASDECSCGVACVKVSVENKDTGKFWNGCEWVDECTWFTATGTDNWCFDASCIPFATDTHYTFTAKAFDCAKNSSEIDKDSIACVFCPTDKIYLAPGWNFISIPDRVTSDYDTFGELLEGVVFQAAFAYEPCSGWIPLTCDTPVKVLTGYWICVPETCPAPNIIKLRYDTNSATVPESKCLTGDAWNAIGPTGEKAYECKPVAEALLSITTTTVPNLGSWSSLVSWNAECQQYEEAILFPGLLDNMITGKGYWIFICNGNGDVLSEFSADTK